MFFHVVQHYSPPGAGSHVCASTLFSTALARQSDKVATVLVVDGSEASDPTFAERVRELGAQYLHGGRRLTFAEGYNLGLAQSDQPWTILSASDIYPSPEVFEVLAGLCCDPPGTQTGCIVPRLSRADLGLQESGRDHTGARIELPLMTLNLNAFPTDYLRAIGGIPETFSGNYNDVLLARRMACDSRAIILAPVDCLHFGSLTLRTGASHVSYEHDLARFATEFPELYREGDYWHVRLEKFTRQRRLKLLSLTARLFPKDRRWRGIERGMQRLLRPGS